VEGIQLANDWVNFADCCEHGNAPMKHEECLD